MPMVPMMQLQTQAPEPEDEMTPGTERAIMTLSDHVPQINNKLSKLVGLLEGLTKPKPQAPSPNDSMAAALVLTRKQWIELVEAITTKAERVHRGDYTPMEEGYSAGEWYDDLRLLREAVLVALKDQGITL